MSPGYSAYLGTRTGQRALVTQCSPTGPSNSRRPHSGRASLLEEHRFDVGDQGGPRMRANAVEPDGIAREVVEGRGREPLTHVPIYG
jgi:hypothetical protein